MDRRRFFSVGALAPLALAKSAMSAEATAVNRDPQFFGDPVAILRLEEDETITAIEGWVSGSIYLSRNVARERRVDMGLGENHWDLIHYPLASYDEAYYQQQHVKLDARYWDEPRLLAGLVSGPITLSQLAHVSDPGNGLHRWLLSDEDWQGVEWKWDIGSVEPAQHFEWRRVYGDKTWMWV